MKQEKFSSLKVKKVNLRIIILTAILIISEILIILIDYKIINSPSLLTRGLKIFTVSVTTLLIASLIIRLTQNWIFNLYKNDVEPEQRIFLTKLYHYAIYFIALAVIFNRLGMAMQNITILLGFAATGFAFAMRDVIMSYFVWMIIMIKKPFKAGDFIKIGDKYGTIEKIGTFFLTVKARQKEGTFIKHPNKILLDQPIINFGQEKYIIDFIKFPLSRIPANMDKKLIIIKKKIKDLLQGRETENLYLDIEGDKIFLTISYKVELQNKFTTQTAVITCIAKELPAK